MLTPYDIDVRPAPARGWGWRVLRFADGRMDTVAYGYARFAWMARVDARRCVARNQHLLVVHRQRR